MKRWIPMVMLLPLLLLCPGASAGKPETAGPLRVHLKKATDDAIGFRATIRIRTTADAILAVFDDVDVAERWVYRCADHAMVKPVDFAHRYTYQLHDLPWPAADRDVVLHHTVTTLPGEGHYRITMTNRNGMKKPRDGIVRIPFVRSVYDIRTVDNGWVEVTWTHRFNPGGSLPKGLARPYLRKLAGSMNKLAILVQQARFATQKIQFAGGRPTGFSH